MSNGEYSARRRSENVKRNAEENGKEGVLRLSLPNINAYK
jgi:hypothetical protein